MIDRQRHMRSVGPQQIKRIKRFWQKLDWARKDMERAINGSTAFDMGKWMQVHLRSVDPRLDWTAERGYQGGYRMSLGCGPHQHLRPILRAMIDTAPSLPSWSFTTWREPYELGDGLGRVRSLTGFDPSRVTVRVERGRHHRFNLTYFIPDPASRPAAQWKLILHLLTETLLGEDMVEIWIGEIGHAEIHHGRYRSIRLDQFIDEMERQAAMLARTLPDEPPHRLADKLPWQEYKLDPRGNASSFPEKTDMTWCRTVVPDLLESWLAGDRVYSERFTAFDESYVYLKCRFDSPAQQSGFRDRLNMRLARDRLGGMVGEGKGLAYGYLDYALSDVSAAVPVIREVAARMGLAKRSWLLFYDADLRAEWVPLHPDAPRPPLVRSQMVAA
ncbi:MAG: hypothetical protein Alpg2KO_15680 [Alphaproteobacteria bacterium]